MKLKVQLQASADEVFDQFLGTLIQDINHSTGQIVETDELHVDYCYNKSLRNQAGYEVIVKVQINELIPSAKYSATLEDPRGTHKIAYTLNNTAKGVEVTYMENYRASSPLHQLNYLLLSLIASRSSKKKMRKQLKVLDQQILNAKANNNEVLLCPD